MKKCLTVKGQITSDVPIQSPPELTSFSNLEHLIKSGFTIDACIPYFEASSKSWLITFILNPPEYSTKGPR